MEGSGVSARTVLVWLDGRGRPYVTLFSGTRVYLRPDIPLDETERVEREVTDADDLTEIAIRYSSARLLAKATERRRAE